MASKQTSYQTDRQTPHLSSDGFALLGVDSLLVHVVFNDFKMASKLTPYQTDRLTD